MLAQAETIDGVIVEGFNMHNLYIYTMVNIAKEELPPTYALQTVAIKPETLRYKVGESFYSMEELEAVAELIEVMRFKE